MQLSGLYLPTRLQTYQGEVILVNKEDIRRIARYASEAAINRYVGYREKPANYFAAIEEGVEMAIKMETYLHKEK